MTTPAQAAKLTQMAVLVAYAPPPTVFVRASMMAAVIVCAGGPNVIARTSQMALVVAYAIGVPNQSRSRCWTFTLDGHIFYVLDLGPEGTYLYDKTTKQWCKWYGDGQPGWNMKNGTMWGTNRIIGGDAVTDQVWELDPSAVLDEGWRDIPHVVTGGLATRNRVYHSVEAFRVSASAGQLDEVNGTTMTLQYSDDQGQTWSKEFTITLEVADFSQEIAWRSLGSFNAPGRIFQITDIGGLIRIDGANADIDNFDEDTQNGGEAN